MCELVHIGHTANTPQSSQSIFYICRHLKLTTLRQQLFLCCTFISRSQVVIYWLVINIMYTYKNVCIYMRVCL